MDTQSDIFLSLIESHKGIIYKVANSYCRIVEDRRDLIQEIILQLWRSFDKYDSRYKYTTWMYRIALNTAISFYRKSRVQNEQTIVLSDFIEDSLAASETTEADPRLEMLQRFIKELKEIDRALILLYLDGKSQKETAEIMGISPTNVSTKIARIKILLKMKFANANL